MDYVFVLFVGHLDPPIVRFLRSAAGLYFARMIDGRVPVDYDNTIRASRVSL